MAGALPLAASISSAASLAGSGGSSAGGSQNTSNSFSQTYGTEASQRAAIAANSANEAANAAWEKAAAFNREEAQKTRDWNERMANTVYQRTVKDMIAAGINPVLAANMGLGTASTNSGATATMGNPMSYMANTYPDSQSSSHSQGNSWNESLSGLAYLADAISGAISAINSSQQINIAFQGLEDLLNPNKGNPEYTGTDDKGNMKEGYTKQYDSDKKKYLTKNEVKNESWLEGMYRGLRNMTNAHLFIN